MHCNQCDYTGEHLLLNRNEKLSCPECESTLERKAVQQFNIGNSKKSGTNNNHPDIVKIEDVTLQCSCDKPIYGELLAVRKELPTSPN